MARGPAKDKVAVIAPAVAVNSEHDDLVRKRDAFVTSMSMLRNAAEEASRAGLAYFDHIIGAPNGNHQFTTYSRALSVAPPVRATTEEPEGPLKRAPRRKREKRDPGLPKRPMTAYLLFCNQGRDTVKKDLGEGASHKDVIAELTRRWAEVPEDQKKAWQDLYQKNRVVYDKELAEYKASKEPHLEVAAPAAAVTAISSFTAVNHTEPAEESDAESEAEPEATKAVEPEESELSEAEPEEEAEEEEEEEEEEDEEEVKAPTPPPPPPSRSKATPRGKKAVNGASASVKKTPIPAPVAATTPATKEKEKRKRTSSRKKAAEEEAVVEESPKKKTKRRRKSTAE